MTLTIKAALLLCSVVCFVLSGFGVPAGVNWDGLGKTFFVASFLA